jgi:predicted Zn-dependent protease
VIALALAAAPGAPYLPGMSQIFRLTRRTLFPALAGGALIAAAPGCSENTVTGRNQLMLVSDAQLEKMSAQMWQEMKVKAPPPADAGVQKRLETIGRKVADASGQGQLNWEFVAFDSAEINAFVLPGGKVGFYTGLMNLAGSDDEIAAVMGHEAGHVTARHAAERMSQQMAVQAGVQLATIALSGEFGANADDIAGVLGLGLMYGVVMPYSRRHELEADRLGVNLASQAGYDPNGAPIFWQRMIALNAERPQPLAWLSTHPADDVRLAALRAEIAKL